MENDEDRRPRAADGCQRPFAPGYYETRELILSDRTSGGQRVYADDAIERVDLIQRLFGAGLSSSDVVELLPCIYSGTTTPAMVGRLERERDRIDDQLVELTATRDRLSQVLVEARERLVGATSS